MKHVTVIRPALALAFIAVLLAGYIADASQYRDPDKYQFYPCSQCHATMKVTGMVKKQPFHGIDLTKGAHAGLYCVNCHAAPQVDRLKTRNGYVDIAIPGLMGHEELMKLNKVCERCHPQTYRDYMHLAHANKTYTCSGGSVEIVKGYKGIAYDFHVCSEYKNLAMKPAKACVECHDPHVGVYPAISIMPPHSERPAPPPEETIAYGLIAAVTAGLALLLTSVALASHTSRQ
ncbi:MAG: hypothetical protein DSY37_02460 [Hyperthermus sp.]|nr:MAG: hypothetical protein DSY37_02460 [Hyperthermus sp.]